MGHRAVAVPEEDLAGAEVLEHVPDLGDHRLRRAGDDRHALLLVLVAAEDVGGFGLLLFACGQRGRGCGGAPACGGGGEVLDRGQDVGAAGQAGQVLQVGADDALVALQEGVARALQVAAAGLFGQLLGLVDVDLEEIAWCSVPAS